MSLDLPMPSSQPVFAGQIVLLCECNMYYVSYQSTNLLMSEIHKLIYKTRQVMLAHGCGTHKKTFCLIMLSLICIFNIGCEPLTKIQTYQVELEQLEPQ